MSESVKVKLRAMSLGILPSDAQGIDLSKLERRDHIRKQNSQDSVSHASPESESSVADSSSSATSPHPPLTSLKVTFQDNLPGNPIDSKHASLRSTTEATGVAVSSIVDSPSSLRRAAGRKQAPANASAPASPFTSQIQTPIQHKKTFKVDYAAPAHIEASKQRDVPLADVPAVHRQRAPKSRRFSVWSGEIVDANDDVPSAGAEAGANQAGSRRRNHVFVQRSPSMFTLKDLNEHSKDINALELTTAALSLGGLGVAVRKKCCWQLALACTPSLLFITIFVSSGILFARSGAVV
jgi:hypothetical protein